ncbi:TetR/AcrR family transcriptional regulator [Kitasatospora sp. GP82]|uniref:TetR/AcrR family transcriptional regulator n=1 Tax=Kitasatospora sp. GP82 TaxID=3035089 RepID=UPI00247348A9|nr:TetR/AcrR family transcriptional regulator [Kitasatospora sp. GP82]MDH6129517.1 AcrR family transcriptional regulator [Kitasatospora sp. GP82]
MTQERALRTRERVLDAAAEEFATQGYANTTLLTVAGRIGMSKGAMYGHFTSKEQLAAALVQQAEETWRQLRHTYEGGAEDTEGRTGRGRGETDGDAHTATALHRLTLDIGRRLRSEVRLRAAARLIADRSQSAADGPAILREIYRVMLSLARATQEAGRIPRPYRPELVAQLLLTVVSSAQHAGHPRGSGRQGSRWEDEARLLLTMIHGEVGSGYHVSDTSES